AGTTDRTAAAAGSGGGERQAGEEGERQGAEEEQEGQQRRFGREDQQQQQQQQQQQPQQQQQQQQQGTGESRREEEQQQQRQGGGEGQQRRAGERGRAPRDALMVIVDVSVADPQREGNAQFRRMAPTQIGGAAARRVQDKLRHWRPVLQGLQPDPEFYACVVETFGCLSPRMSL
ncbi:hypothetical protein CLOP_g14735, partial [Closterium sp. NIES-67]